VRKNDLQSTEIVDNTEEGLAATKILYHSPAEGVGKGQI